VSVPDPTVQLDPGQRVRRDGELTVARHVTTSLEVTIIVTPGAVKRCRRHRGRSPVGTAPSTVPSARGSRPACGFAALHGRTHPGKGARHGRPLREPSLRGAASVGTAGRRTEVMIAMVNSDRFSLTLHNITTTVRDDMPVD
ncbi:hypothetical protein ACFV2Z_38360, partial [Streptomyces sp. NPDC059688]|uniref:hypothetical protein n=1 Tax=Streptomyces sp. NPDC059688 TaxID=3346906 RepID=UPI0036A31A0D